MTDARESILVRIRAALLDAQVPELPPPLAAASPVAASPRDAAIRFRSELERLGGSYAWFDGSDDAARGLAKILDERGLSRVACFDVPWLTLLARSAGIDTIEKDLAECDACITPAHLLVADLGAVVIASSAVGSRAATALAPVHIVVAQTSQLVWSLADAVERIEEAAGEQSLPSDVLLIAGPSRTADIEKTLVIPAHGPRELCVILIGRL